MKLSIMQPYFFPYLGHFALIAAVDEWIVFDISQYARKSWINRNRVLHPNSSWQYLSIPLRNSSIHMKISEAEVANLRDQEKYVLGKISHYKRHAPYYAQVCDVVRSTFAGAADDRLVSLNVSGLRTVCQYLGLSFRYRLCSQLALRYPDKLLAGQWAPWISGRLGADTYINPVAGRELFDPSDFTREGVSLQFLQFETFVYDTAGYSFEKDLSILDVLMWNSPDAIVRTLHERSSLRAA
ncbi:MAG TPA: WbqC family protein [Xanthobacteraceae bacterium]|nr:WbqC family protein [Xanthobacteraceae bacterium]